MTYKLYNRAGSGGFAPEAALAVAGLPYDLILLDSAPSTPLPASFRDINPWGQVPVLITESGTALFESDAIVEYLDEIAPPLEAERSPEEKALDRAWSYQAAKHYLSQCSTMRSADESTYRERKSKLATLWAKAEKQLGNGPFFKGDTLSNIDVAWMPLLHRAAIIHNCTGEDLLEGYPGVQRWQNELLKTGLAERSVAHAARTSQAPMPT